MASEIRVDKINSLSGVGTVTLSPTGVDIAGITTAATLKATTGIVTTLTATTGIVTNFTANAVNIGIDTGVYGEDLVVTGNTRVTGITTFGDSDNPASMLNIDATSGLPSISIPDSIIHSGDTNTKIRFPAADTVTVETGGSEAARFDSNGYLGLHITDPHLYYSKTLVVGAETEGDGGGITIKGASTHTNYLMFADSNSGAARYDGYIGYSHNSQKLHLASAGASRAYVDSSGNLTIGNGNLVIGTSGKGIDFSVTGDSSGTMSNELLDDYEEGAWQPTIGGNNMSVNHAHYTKIGNFVHLDFDITGTASANGNTIAGLPFAATQYSDVHFGWVSDSSGGSQNTTALQGGLLSSAGFTMRTAGGNVNMSVANGQRVIGSAQYRTA
jgi:hypothetical protein